MAKSTCPKYTRPFLIIPRKHDCTPTVLRMTASTEEEVHDTFPCWNLIFATKIRTESSLRDSGCGIYGLNLLTLEMLEVHNV